MQAFARSRTTNPVMSQNISFFHPSALRCFALSMIAGLPGGGLAALLLLMTDAKNMWIAGTAMIGFLLGTLLYLPDTRRAWSIIITDNYISGPSGWWGGNMDIPIPSVNRNAQCAQSFLMRLRGVQFIHSLDGKKIRIEQRAFTVEQIREMQDRLDRWQSSDTHIVQAPA
jgi:hypothetical protein